MRTDNNWETSESMAWRKDDNLAFLKSRLRTSVFPVLSQVICVPIRISWEFFSRNIDTGQHTISEETHVHWMLHICLPVHGAIMAVPQ